MGSKEEYELKKAERQKTKKRYNFNKKAKKLMGFLIWILFAAVVIVALILLLAKLASKPTNDLSLCIQHTRLVMHDHFELEIRIKDKNYEIPANVGITPSCMRPIHTHDNTGTIHVEFPYQRVIKLKDFFEVWGKRFNKDCIFDFCSNSERVIKMFVNGSPNFDFENYIIKDGDRIEIVYE